MEEQDPQQAEIRPDEPVVVEELIPQPENVPLLEAVPLLDYTPLRAAIEALVYVAEEPLTLAQIANLLQQPAERVRELMGQVAAEFEKPEHGVAIREVAGGYQMSTKPEHHETVRAFAKSLKPPLKLSLAALETLAVIAYKQPVTVPEIQEVRGVQGGGVVKTLLDRKLIVMAGRKNVLGKPILYKTTKDFLVQFGLKDLSELPSLKEFEEIRRIALSDADSPPSPAPEQPADDQSTANDQSRDREGAVAAEDQSVPEDQSHDREGAPPAADQSVAPDDQSTAAAEYQSVAPDDQSTADDQSRDREGAPPAADQSAPDDQSRDSEGAVAAQPPSPAPPAGLPSAEEAPSPESSTPEPPAPAKEEES